MTAPLSVQMYSLGSAPVTDPVAVCARLAALGYKAIEPVIISEDEIRIWIEKHGVASLPSEMRTSAPLHPVDATVLKRALDQHGLVAPSAHVTAMPDGVFTNEILDEMEMLGCHLLVAPAAAGEAGAFESFDDLDRIKMLAELFNLNAERARPRGMRVGYHNHFWEFGTDFDGRSGLEVFFDLVEPDVFAEVDIFWAQAGGRDPVELVKSLGDRVRLLHIRDGNGKLDGTNNCCPLGEGAIDLPGVLGQAGSAEWHVVEPEHLSEKGDVWFLLEQYRRYLLDNNLSQ
jgi:sugar phosphate isomerase/epimerase